MANHICLPFDETYMSVGTHENHPCSTPAGQRALRLKSLQNSQKEAVASSTMTASCDNFINPFALYLGADNLQMGLLTGFPQLIGATFQLVSVWLGTWFTRKQLVLFAAIFQTFLMFAFATLAVSRRGGLMTELIMLFMMYHAAFNFIQPQWRAWMGKLVSADQRGHFFASRSRLTVATSIFMFVAGGLLLALSARFDAAWIGFLFLFIISAIGRAFSCYFLSSMHESKEWDNGHHRSVFSTLSECRAALHNSTFRNYSLFFAGMQGAVSVSAPFFAVYMLQELNYSYLEYAINQLASIGTQFFMLKYWGSFSDRFGSRFMMLLSSSLIPAAPILWIFSENYYWLLLVQIFSGFAWSGYNLTTANYLYDIRPHQTDFASYAALQAQAAAIFVFFGSLLGGLLATQAQKLSIYLPFSIGSTLYIVFTTSGLIRLLVLLWFIPRADEPRIRTRPQLLKIIYRIARFNPISGLVLDWLTVTVKEKSDKDGR